jgi:transposase
VDDRRVVSGILHVLKTGCRWRDVPAEYGPPTTWPVAVPVGVAPPAASIISRTLA